jgi:hypothetical protein
MSVGSQTAKEAKKIKQIQNGLWRMKLMAEEVS